MQLQFIRHFKVFQVLVHGMIKRNPMSKAKSKVYYQLVTGQLSITKELFLHSQQDVSTATPANSPNKARFQSFEQTTQDHTAGTQSVEILRALKH